MKRDGVFVSGVSLFQDAKSPYWWAQWSLSDGSRVKKSTKVPLVGGLFQGERLSKPQAKRRALLVAQELAAAAQVEAERQDNLSVRELFDTVLKGKLELIGSYPELRQQAEMWDGVSEVDPVGWMLQQQALENERLAAEKELEAEEYLKQQQAEATGELFSMSMGM